MPDTLVELLNRLARNVDAMRSQRDQLLALLSLDDPTPAELRQSVACAGVLAAAAADSVMALIETIGQQATQYANAEASE